MSPLGPRARQANLTHSPVPVLLYGDVAGPEVMCGHQTPMRVSRSERQCVAISTVIRGTGSTLQFAVAQMGV